MQDDEPKGFVSGIDLREFSAQIVMTNRRSMTFRRDPTRWLVVSGILLIVAIAVATTCVTGSFRERILNSSERELDGKVLLLARHLDQELENFEVVQNDIAELARSSGPVSPDVFREQMSTPEMQAQLKAKISGSSDTAGLDVYDYEGNLINSSGSSPTLAINIADRTYFKFLKSGSASTPHQIELVRDRTSSALANIIARRINSPDGMFLGVVTRGFIPAKFERFFASVTLGSDAAISMFDPDGVLLARYPHVDGMVGRQFAPAPRFKEIASDADQYTSRHISPIDGQERLIAVRNLSRFPVSVVATTTVESVLENWREQTRYFILAAGLSALVIAAILFLIVRQLSRQHQISQHDLILKEQRLGTVVNNLSQGITLYDASQRLVLCNQRYLEIYGLSPSVVHVGCSLRSLIEHRLAVGSLRGDADEICAHILANIDSDKMPVDRTPNGRSVQIAYRRIADGGWVTTHEDVTERKQFEDRIAHLAHHDALTGLPNRKLFRDRIAHDLTNLQPGDQIAIHYIDIDEFKSINDLLGHSVGDELLKFVGSRLQGCLGSDDLIARLGGDEFAIVQTGVRQSADVLNLVSRIFETMRQPYSCLGHQLTCNASIGIAVAPRDGSDLDQLLKNADLAMYSAKSDGRRSYRFFEPAMSDRLQARCSLELDLRQAIVNREFEIHYQPVVSLHNDQVSGCEALLRWRHSQRGMISPAEFIPLAEETGLIEELGEWVLTKACADAAGWPSHVRIAVNVSPVQFKSKAFALKVASALASSGLPAHRLELEITEAVLIRDDDTTLATLDQLRALGIRLALDDFGTGYSSLSYLQRFPFDKIKIDQCFVRDIATTSGSAAIVQAVVNIAASRDMTTTAEGVETSEQKELLRLLGCTEMQGYFFSPGVPSGEIERMLFGRQPEKVCEIVGL